MIIFAAVTMAMICMFAARKLSDQLSSAANCSFSLLRSSACRSRISTRLSKSTPAASLMFGSLCMVEVVAETCHIVKTNSVEVTVESEGSFKMTERSEEYIVHRPKTGTSAKKLRQDARVIFPASCLSFSKCIGERINIKIGIS